MDKKLYRINNVPIFEAGDWKGGDVKISEDEVQGIVDAATELKERIIPYIFLGHSSKDSTMDMTGKPTAGVLENIRRVGKQIVADLIDLPKAVFELVRDGGYRRTSVELWQDWKDGVSDKVYKYVLSGMALLGAEHPAVNVLPKNIGDYAKLYNSADNVRLFIKSNAELAGAALEFVEPAKELEPKKGGVTMDEKKLIEDLANAKAKLEASEKANADLVVENKAKVEELEKTIEADEKEKLEAAEKVRDEKIANFIETAVEAGKLLPAQEEMYINTLKGADDLDAEIEKMQAIFEEMPKIFNIGGKAKPETEKELAEDAKGRVKLEIDSLARDLKNMHLQAPDEKEVVEFSAAFSTRKAGERSDGTEQAREALEKELKSYIS